MTDKQFDEEYVVPPLSWQEVIRTAHRRALEEERQKKVAETAGTDTPAPA
ncbi:hypothetical protein [Haloferax sp. DFSO52]